MITLTIDNQIVSVAEGSSILQAARQLGIAIPTLCYAEGYCAESSCLLCLVRVQGRSGYIPSCASIATEGMVIESESAAVHAARRAALELLLGEHKGDCLAPCQLACPLHLDIPRLLRYTSAGEREKAEKMLLAHTVFPRLSAHLCAGNSEKACRRGQLDSALAICKLHRYLADRMSDELFPDILPESGKTVVIIGAGLAGISAAWQLSRLGHKCTLYDRQMVLGGKLASNAELHEILQADLSRLARLGISFLPQHSIDDAELATLAARYDALLLATGVDSLANFASLAAEDVKLLRKTHQSMNYPRIFFAGANISANHKALSAMTDGREAALVINDYLCHTASRPSRFSVHIGKMIAQELTVFLRGAIATPRVEVEAGYDYDEAMREAQRCLNCDCRALASCKLRDYAIKLHADLSHFQGERRFFQVDESHEEIVFEAGKCISCGLCIQAAQHAGEATGLTFIGRGFTINTAAPFNENIAAALPIAGTEAVRICPTGALAWKNRDDENE